MPRINEHKFIFENIDYKLTFFPKESAIVYINEKIYTGNRTVLLKKYIAYLGLDTKLDGLTPQQLSSIVLNHFSELNNKGFKKTSQKLESNKNNKPNSSSITNYTNQIEIEKLSLSKKFKVVLVCASGKNDSFFTTYPNDYFVNNSLNINEHHPDEKMEQEKITWREYLINNQNDNNLLEAYMLYKRDEYRSLFKKFKNDFYILSAGWGLVNSEYKLPKYDITFSNGGNVPPNTIRNRNLFVNPIYHDFKQININNKEDIVFSGGEAYLNLFYNLTMHINSRKIIFYFGPRPRIPIWVINRNNFYFVRYISNNKRGWHYEAACDL